MLTFAANIECRPLCDMCEMKKVLAFYTLISVLTLMSGCSGRGEEMREHLLSLEAANRADSVMRNDSLAEAVAAYFDRHGTPNERMRAYYMLGRTYADLGELPKALEAYIHAEGSADTLANDCNYDLLCRVHAQKAALFDRQYLPNETLKELNEAIRCAYRCQDTLTALVCYENRIRAFMQLARHDDMFVTADSAFNQYQRLGKNVMAANAVSGSIYYLIQQDKLTKAKGYIDFCRNTIDTVRNVYNRIGLLYSDLGYYYLKKKLSDSAVVYFRKQIQLSSWLENRVLGCKGLFKAYQQLGLKDSAMKYAELYNIANDSSNIFESADRLQRMQSLYNYERSRDLAEQKTREAERAHNTVIGLIGLIVIILLVIVVIALNYKKKREMLLQQYWHDMSNLEKAQSDLIVLREEQQISSEIIERKNREINDLQAKVSAYQEKIERHHQDSLESRLKESSVVKHIRQLANGSPAQLASQEDFRQLRMLINELIPSFYATLNIGSHPLTVLEYDVCLLIRANFSPSEICKLTGISDSYASNIRKRLLLKIYGIEGAPKDFDRIIKEISR